MYKHTGKKLRALYEIYEHGIQTKDFKKLKQELHKN